VDIPKGAKMRQEIFMARRKRRKFTPEFKAEAVRLTRIGDRSIGQVALDLDLMETHLRDCGPRLRLDRRKAPKTGELVVRAEAMVA
jgi:transposase-like protein